MKAEVKERVWEGGTRNVEVAMNRTVCIAGGDQGTRARPKQQETELETATHATKADQVSEMDGEMCYNKDALTCKRD